MNGWLGPNSHKSLSSNNYCWLGAGITLVGTAAAFTYVLCNVDYSNIRLNLDDLPF